MPAALGGFEAANLGACRVAVVVAVAVAVVGVLTAPCSGCVEDNVGVWVGVVLGTPSAPPTGAVTPCFGGTIVDPGARVEVVPPTPPPTGALKPTWTEDVGVGEGAALDTGFPGKLVSAVARAESEVGAPLAKAALVPVAEAEVAFAVLAVVVVVDGVGVMVVVEVVDGARPAHALLPLLSDENGAMIEDVVRVGLGVAPLAGPPLGGVEVGRANALPVSL